MILMEMNGGDILLRQLHNEGVKFIFTLPGGQIAPISDAVYRWGKEEGIDTIAMRHEQACGHAADAYARVTGTVGVCLATAGPGAADLVPGVSAAWADNTPLIAITGNVWNAELGKSATQGDLDQIGLFKPITKWSKFIQYPNEMQQAVKTAFRHALSGPPGPVHLDITTDALIDRIEVDIESFTEPNSYRTNARPAADPLLLKHAAKMILKAERPIFVAGGGVMMAEAWMELQELAEYLQIPVTNSLRGTGAISDDHYLYVPLIYPFFKGMHEADVVVLFGSKMGGDLTFGNPPLWGESDQKLIHVDIDSKQIGKNRTADIGIVADVKLALQGLLKIVKELVKNPRSEYNWVIYLKDYKEKDRKRDDKKFSAKIPIKPQHLALEIGKFIDKNSIIILDGGDITVFGLQYVRVFQPRSFLMSCGMGHLGFGIPAAIGAQLARPNAQVVVLQGDGAFMFNIQELETAKRYNLPIINVIANNSCWGMIRNCQKIAFQKRFIDVDFGGVDYVKLAEAFGCYGERVEKPEEIKGALKRAFDSNLPSIIDVVVDMKETPMGDSVNYARYVR